MRYLIYYILVYAVFSFPGRQAKFYLLSILTYGAIFKKLSFFCFGLILSFLMSIILGSQNQETGLKENIDNSLFIWGDSNLSRIRFRRFQKVQKQSRLVYSSAHVVVEYMTLLFLRKWCLNHQMY